LARQRDVQGDGYGMGQRLMPMGLVLLWCTTVWAGGVERSTQSTAILFEQGRYVELGYTFFNPEVSGSMADGRVESGDMVKSRQTFTLAYKQDLFDETLDLALVLDEPVGANVHYPEAEGSYPLAGTTAAIDSNALTALFRCHLPEHVSLIGGGRGVRSSGDAGVPVVAGYSMHTSTETDFGYVLGLAWEYPAYHMRVNLTYNSELTHDFTAREQSALLPGGMNTEFSTTLPQSVNLELQSGVAPDTVLFGSIRWVDWTAFEVAPSHWQMMGQSPLVFYANDSVTYTLGLGHRLNETWTGAVVVGYEEHFGDWVANLCPMDGMLSASWALGYTVDRMTITSTLSYVDIGDATTDPPISARFTDNSGWGGGIRLGVAF
jgi:long-chain fatty acid transport protein